MTVLKSLGNATGHSVGAPENLDGSSGVRLLVSSGVCLGCCSFLSGSCVSSTGDVGSLYGVGTGSACVGSWLVFSVVLALGCSGGMVAILLRCFFTDDDGEAVSKLCH